MNKRVNPYFVVEVDWLWEESENFVEIGIFSSIGFCNIRRWNELANYEQDKTTEGQTQLVRAALPGFAIRNCENFLKYTGQTKFRTRDLPHTNKNYLTAIFGGTSPTYIFRFIWFLESLLSQLPQTARNTSHVQTYKYILCPSSKHNYICDLSNSVVCSLVERSEFTIRPSWE